MKKTFKICPFSKFDPRTKKIAPGQKNMAPGPKKNGQRQKPAGRSETMFGFARMRTYTEWKLLFQHVSAAQLVMRRFFRL